MAVEIWAIGGNSIVLRAAYIQFDSLRVVGRTIWYTLTHRVKAKAWGFPIFQETQACMLPIGEYGLDTPKSGRID